MFCPVVVPGKTPVVVWPDGEWVYEEEYDPADWTHKSDDIYVLWIPDEHDEEEVPLFIESHEAGL